MDLNYKSEEMDKNIEPFFYHYRSIQEKDFLQNEMCKTLNLFYNTVCLNKKNKANPNCFSLSKEILLTCKK